MKKMRWIPFLGIALLSSSELIGEEAAKLALPTDNKAIFGDNPDDYYMYVDRNFEGVKSKPWEGGAYGFVRTSMRTELGVINLKFHEGIDIKPALRDKNNVPLDDVRPISAGVVVHVSDNPRGSNYGRYIVIEHNWGSGPFYTLYAHLNAAYVKMGEQVNEQTKIGLLGFTGEGIDKTRAHLHLEFNMLLSHNFDAWHIKNFGAANKQGLYNGMNLIGSDVSMLLKKSNEAGSIMISEGIRSQETYYRVTFPRTKQLELITRYPWLCQIDPNTPSPSWEVSLTNAGIPVAIVPSQRAVTQPTVTYVKPSQIDHRLLTKGHITGTGQVAKLTKQGLQFIELIQGPEPIPVKVTPQVPPKAPVKKVTPQKVKPQAKASPNKKKQ